MTGPRGRAAVLAADVAAAALGAVLLMTATARPRTLHLRFFPTLQDHVSGFEDPGLARKRDEFLWTRARGRVDLPLLAVGPSRLTLWVSSPAGPRLVRVEVSGTAVAEARVEGSDVVALRGTLPRGWHALDVEISAEALNDRRRGVRAHGLEISSAGGVLVPAPRVLLALAAGIVALAVLFRASGFASGAARGLAVALLGISAAVAAAFAPLAAAHLVLALWWAAPAVGLAGWALMTLASRWPLGELAAPDVRRDGAVLLVVATLARGGVLLHPDHHYKDRLTHDRITSLVLERGVVDVWTRMPQYQHDYELGTTFVPGGLSTIRYPPVFYTLAAAPAAVQRALTGEADVSRWNRLLAVAVSALQILPVFWITRRVWPRPRAALVAGLLQAFCPVDLHELVRVSYAAILGKLADLAFLALAVLTASAAGPRRLVVLALALCACLLLYPGSWVNLGVLLALVLLLEAARGAWRPALGLGLAGLLAAAAADALFYRGLLWSAVTVHLPAGLHQHAAAATGTAVPIDAWGGHELTGYFSRVHVAAAAAGLALLLRSVGPGPVRSWLGAWALALPALLLLQDWTDPLLRYFRPLFLTGPLLALLPAVAATALAGDRPGPRRAAAIGLVLLLLTVLGLRVVLLVPGFYTEYHGRLPPARLF